MASHGGTPEKGVWIPSCDQWREIAACGQYGLVYAVLSPDFQAQDSNFPFNPHYPTVRWIAETLLAGGVLPATGHFCKADPKASAMALQIAANFLRGRKCIFCGSFKVNKTARRYVKCRLCGKSKSLKKLNREMEILKGFYQQQPAYRLTHD